MKKQLLTLVAILLGITALQAKELYKVQFGKDYNSKGITSYSGSFDVKLNKSDTEDFATVKNCNNNNNGWSYVRLGGKNACVASITTKKAIEEKIDQIDLRLYKREANSSISVKLCVCPDSKFETNVTTYDITSEISALSVDKNSITEPTQPTVSVDITPVSGMYYKLEFDMPKLSNNGGIQLHTIVFNGEEDNGKTDIGLAFSADEVSYDIVGEAALVTPTLSRAAGFEDVPVVYSSSNEAVATVAADGTVTPLAKGTTTITASVPEDNATYSGSASYTLVLANSDLLEDTFDFTKANAYGILTGNSNSDLSKADFECVEGVVTMGYKYKSGTGYRIFNSSGSGYELRIQKQSSGASAGTLTFSVGKGYKITSIKMEGDAVTKSDLSFAEGVYNYGSKVGTWEPSDAKVYKSVSVEVTDQVKVRTITVAFARVPIAGMAVINHDENQVTITAEEGATIYYTTDNSEPTTDSDVYSAPFGITETSTIKALVVVPEKEESDVATYEALYVVAPQTTWEAHNKAATEALGLESSGVIDPTQPDYNRFMLTGIQGGVYFTIVAPEGHDLWISLDGQGSASTVKKVASYAFVPTPKAEDIELHKVEGGRAEKVVVQYSGTLRYYSVHPESGKSSNVMVISFSGTTGVEDITVDGSSNAEVEYYDLQGVRVANPENGLYIRRQGNSVTKVLVK